MAKDARSVQFAFKKIDLARPSLFNFVTYFFKGFLKSQTAPRGITRLVDK